MPQIISVKFFACLFKKWNESEWELLGLGIVSRILARGSDYEVCFEGNRKGRSFHLGLGSIFSYLQDEMTMLGKK